MRRQERFEQITLFLDTDGDLHVALGRESGFIAVAKSVPKLQEDSYIYAR